MIVLSPELLEESDDRMRGLECLVSNTHLIWTDLPIRIINTFKGMGIEYIGPAVEAFEKNPRVCPGFGPKSQQTFIDTMNGFGIIVIRPRTEGGRH